MAQLEELEKELVALKAVVSSLKARERAALESEYQRVYEEMSNALLKTVQIENTIENTYEKLGIADLMGDLILINNPYEDKLGFRFVDIIENQVKAVLLSDLKGAEGETKKNRFLSILKKVINNPVADFILSTNPIGAVASNVINAASNFIDTTYEKLEETKVGNGLKKIRLITRDEIAGEKLEKFSKAISRYSGFYQKLMDATRSFDTRIDILTNNFENVFVTYSDYYEKYRRVLKLGDQNPQKDLEKLFERQNAGRDDFDFRAVLEKEEVAKGLLFIAGLKEAGEQADRFQREFAKTLSDFIHSYIEILNVPINDEWTSEEIDKPRLRQTIRKLEGYLKANTTVKTIAMNGSERELVLLSAKVEKYVA